MFALTFALGSGLAGLGGALGIDVLGLDPTFPLKYMVYFLLVVAVGGAGTIKGPLIAALILGVFDVAGKYYVPQIGGFVIYALMVVLLLLFPSGLYGRRTHERATTPAACVAGVALPDGRWRPLEIAFWLMPVAAFFLLPDYRVLGSQILIVGLFALSLDLILGYAGIVSLGHAAFFGIGAYTAGLLAVHGWGEPLTGLLAAAIAAAAAGFVVSFLVVRGSDLTRLMVTLGIGLMLYEAANKAAFDHRRRRRSFRCHDVEALRCVELRHRRPHGVPVQPCRAVRPVRAHAPPRELAARVEPARHTRRRQADAGDRRAGGATAAHDLHRRAAVAGVAGALLAQTTQFVGIDTLGFPRSAELLIMLVLGGVGRLYGGLVGAAIFMLAQDYLSGLSPVYWQFGIGILLIVVVLFARGGVLGGLASLRDVLRARQAMTAALRTRGLSKAWGAFKANSDVTLSFAPGARHALIGPNGAGKTTFINLLTGVFPPTAGDVFLGDENITGLAQHARVKRGMTRTFQINTLFPGPDRAGVGGACHRRARRPCGRMASNRGAGARRSDRGPRAARTAASRRRRGTLTRNLAYGKQRLVEIALALATRPSILLLDEPAAGIPAGESAELFERDRGFAARRDDRVHRARHEPRVPLRGAHHRAGRRARC